MYTSDNKLNEKINAKVTNEVSNESTNEINSMQITENSKLYIRHIFILLGISIFTFVFSKIYNHYGHGITTPFMDYAFFIPAIGVILYLLLLITKPKRDFGFLFRQGVDLGLITIMFGSICKGVFIIAGTDSSFVVVYPIAGAMLILLAFISYILKK